MQIAVVYLGVSLLLAMGTEAWRPNRGYRQYYHRSVKAVCNLVRDPGTSFGSLRGTVRFVQKVDGDTATGPLQVYVSIDGFPTQTSTLDHGMHVHTNGDITGGCAAAGGHFNPEGVDHGSPFSDVRHVGDFGNIRQDANGRVEYFFEDRLASLVGDNSIINRGLVVHEGTDDLGLGGDAGSRASGNAGPRAACCVITRE